MDALNLKVRTVAHDLDVSETNIRNYLTRDSKPSSDIIEKIVRSYPLVNPVWLITGEGEPLFSETGDPSLIYTKNIHHGTANTLGVNHGTSHQGHIIGMPPAEAAGNQGALELAQKEIAHLREQLASKDAVIAGQAALIAAKEETITLLRSSYNKPN